MRHLLSIEDLDRAAIERICDRAASFAEVADREIKKVPALRGRRVLNLFYEASTRTRSSFELAAEVIDSPQAIIGQQVAAGVVVRMAVLYELLAGGSPPGQANRFARDDAAAEPQPA